MEPCTVCQRYIDQHWRMFGVIRWQPCENCQYEEREGGVGQQNEDGAQESDDEALVVFPDRGEQKRIECERMDRMQVAVRNIMYRGINQASGGQDASAASEGQAASAAEGQAQAAVVAEGQAASAAAGAEGQAAAQAGHAGNGQSPRPVPSRPNPDDYESPSRWHEAWEQYLYDLLE